MMQIKRDTITPEHLYLSRRKFITGLGGLLAGSLLTGACGGDAIAPTATEIPPGTSTPTRAPQGVETTPLRTATVPPVERSATPTQGVAAELTPYDKVVGVNNFYEFTVNQTQVATQAREFVTTPWAVAVGGLVHKPRTFDLDDLARFGEEERIYRMRCVETWSMVIPWLGFPLSKLLDAVEPMSQAQYVRFETLYDPERMPGQKVVSFDWPYVEGLRMDEAMHDLTILGTGLYGKPLPPQNGAPVRVVVPWKYGFKSVKSIVKIDLVKEMPVSFWMAAAPREYGFYANVNPDVPHPRWSQAKERRIGETESRATLLFNGYAEQVAHLYAGMDLSESY
jgi:methionine sulfoxide reductase catalytic subunit